MKIILEKFNDIKYISLGEIINLIVDNFDFYNKSILVGDVASRNRRIDEIIRIFNSLAASNYNLEDAYNYLNELIENDYSIEIDETEEITDSVKIMTIHASKGLEFHICYLYSHTNFLETS